MFLYVIATKVAHNVHTYVCTCLGGNVCTNLVDFIPAQVIQFEFGAYTFMEGDEPAISVVLSSPADSEITVLITSLDGTANGKHQE